jgi:hypothetical protein
MRGHPQAWRGLLDQYVRPPLLDAAAHGSVSFGLGGSGSGVPFHTHGPVFAEVVHGRKVRLRLRVRPRDGLWTDGHRSAGFCIHPTCGPSSLR